MNELKRTQGLCVGDLAERLRMSYMGVKGVCLDLEKRGLLDTWREPRKVGRPHLLYRLTTRAHDLFPTESNAMTLDLLAAAQKLFGATAADKLLLVAFQTRTAQYLARMKGDSLEERARCLARLRDADGCMADCEAGGESGLRIIEHHSPIFDVLQAFPTVAKLEGEMFQRLLGAPVEREEVTASGLFRATFSIAEIASA